MRRRRRDRSGHSLNTGESCRKDGRYQYRYTLYGKRMTVYAESLQELREKEAEIHKDINSGVDYHEGRITVYELVLRYVALKRAVRYNTKQVYSTVLRLLERDYFGRLHICDIRTSDVKLWYGYLQKKGKGYSSITNIRGVLNPAFQMAFEEDIIRRNPFVCKLSGVVVNTTQKRIALTPEQKETWLTYVKNDPTYCKYYDEYIVLLGTGMRVSEFCGLTRQDLDFKNHRICVDKQLVREHGGKYYIEHTKTASGRRFIPMTDVVEQSLRNILRARQKPLKEWVIDGCIGFILLDKDRKPKVALHIENSIRWGLSKYKKLHPEAPLPNITPHVLRHTFCTDMVNAGMDIKSLQYVMGHSEVNITLNVYTHANYDNVEEHMKKAALLTPFLTPMGRRKA